MAFETLIVADQGSERTPIDIGRLGESLIFYGSVHLLVGPRELEYLLQQIDAGIIAELLETVTLQITYRDFVHATCTRTDGVIEFHTPIFASTETFRLDALLEKSLSAGPGRNALVRKLLSLIRTEQQSIGSGAHTHFLEDGRWTSDCILDLLNLYSGNEANEKDVRLVLTNHGSEFTVETNIDFSAVNSTRPTDLPVLNAARFMGMVAQATDQLGLASLANADLHTSQLTSVVSRNVMLPVLTQTMRADGNVECFQTMLFDSGHAIADAINSDERSFSELVPILERSRQFKDWLSDHVAATELVHAYYREVSSGTWLTQLPSKTFRWLISTALGLIPGYGAAVGAAGSFADYFLVDRLMQGWRPNQFVGGPLRNFVRPTRGRSV